MFDVWIAHEPNVHPLRLSDENIESFFVTYSA